MENLKQLIDFINAHIHYYRIKFDYNDIKLDLKLNGEKDNRDYYINFGVSSTPIWFKIKEGNKELDTVQLHILYKEISADEHMTKQLFEAVKKIIE
jgi:hypothetical protein